MNAMTLPRPLLWSVVGLLAWLLIVVLPLEVTVSRTEQAATAAQTD